MKAVIKRGNAPVCEQMPEPIPGQGQVLTGSLVCGICGSDLHTLHHAPEKGDNPR
jgi:threonine dehydrogenase-like Zn-dependent dehydrogenase